jgi:hypothetical protein
MKYLKIFEDFSNGNPKAITVVISEGFKSKMRQIGGECTFTEPFVLVNPDFRGDYNLVKIGKIENPGNAKNPKIPRDITEIGYWITYQPKSNEIVMMESHCNWEDFKALERRVNIGTGNWGTSELEKAQRSGLVLFSNSLEDKIVYPGYDLPTEKHIKDLFTPAEYSKFKKIEEGQSDERDYVKIISIDEENQPYRL